MKYVLWGIYFGLLFTFFLSIAFGAFAHQGNYSSPSPTLTPPSKECEGRDLIDQICITEIPTATPEATLTPSCTPTPEITEVPTEQSKSTIPQPEENEYHDERLAPESLPMPKDEGINK